MTDDTDMEARLAATEAENAALKQALADVKDRMDKLEEMKFSIAPVMPAREAR